ncbi:ABC transporter ATP-binding protein [Lancefieldella sp. Marseille-Q7238]|uniref:ATP-binding cassette domain-containing protein n=1 Tax=Lancefieldella sp. Marseille-Q7238 TaxID=3022127 RepID=UPI0024A84833|nr:ABC transporter ATP-binding protein [Lancefieldella sp. Marseille-Q7238]
MRKLILYCWNSIKNKATYTGYMALKLLKALTDASLPFITGWVINLLVAQTSFYETFVPCALIAFLGVLSALLEYFSDLIYTYLQSDSSFVLEADAIKRIQYTRQDFFSSYDPAYYHRSVNNDASTISIFFLISGSQVITSTVTVVVIIGIVASINILLAFVCCLLTLSVGFVYSYFHNEIFKKNYECKEELSKYASCEFSQFSQVDFIRRHVLFSHFAHALKETYQKLRAAVYSSNKLIAKVKAQNGALTAFCQAILFALGVYQISIGNMQVGYLATIASYYSMLTSAAMYFTEFGLEYQSSLVSYERLMKISTLPTEPNGMQVLDTKIESLVCTDVSFTYPNNTKPVLTKTNAAFEPGKLYALTGHNGCGKSTLLKLIDAEWSGLYDGAIDYNSTELSKLDHYVLREDIVGFTEQEPMILEDTIWNNLTLLCKDEPSKEKVVSLVEQLNLNHLIDSAPQGFNTILDDSHPSLSGGEKQKVAIIRMILKNPQVMLLDEPTSALDKKSIGQLISLLNNLKQNHIVIVVTHDQRLLDSCDSIVEFPVKKA